MSREIVFISGKGGTGKTTITASMAAVALPYAAMADCDVDASDMHLVTSPAVKEEMIFHGLDLPEIHREKCTECGLCVRECRFSAISPSIDVVEDRCEGCGVCELVCPVDAIRMRERTDGKMFVSDTRLGPMVHAALKAGGEGSGKLISMVRERGRREASDNGKELVIVDGPPGIGCPVISSITGTDLAVVVTEPTVSGISDLGRVLEVIEHFNVRALCLINKWDLNKKKTLEIEKFMREKGIPVIGKLPYRPDFSDSQLKRRTLYETADDDIREMLVEIWKSILVELNRDTE